MAVYDPESKKLIVRVVYDGPGMAGKTTNLQQICSSFAPQRRSELYSGPTAASRTLCLDWMHLDGGLVRGHELRCHLLTVPGQAVLNRRRLMLLSMADSVVFVVDSTEEGVRDALPMWRSLLSCTGGPEGGVPAVIQANKQDRPGALSCAAIRERWRVAPAIPILAANAAEGHGVRETVVMAIRAVVVSLQDELTSSGLAELEGSYETGRDLERRMLAAEHGEAGAVLPELGRPAPPEERSAPAAGARRSPLEGAERGVAAGAAPRARQEEVQAAGSALLGVSEVARDRAWAEALSLPSGEVPAGLVWPPADGRKTLRRVPFAEAVRHPCQRDSAARTGSSDGGEPIVFEAGIWRLETSPRRRFASVDAARGELLQQARVKLCLGTLCVPRTAIVAHPGADGAYWVWTVSLWLASLASQIDYALDARDEGGLSDVLSQYARAVVRGLRLCLDSSLVLELHPRSFGVLWEEAFYLGPEPKSGRELPGVGAGLLRPFEELVACPGALRVYLEVLLHELGQQLRASEARELSLQQAIEATRVSTEPATHAKHQLLQLISGSLEG